MCMNTKKFIINKSYGGYGYSQSAVNEYNQRMVEMDKNFKVIRSPTPDYQDIPRDDIVMIKVVEDMGENANDRWSNLKIIAIPYEYYVGVEIEEYEGMEFWKINVDKYKLHKIEEVLFSHVPDYEKISKIYHIISAKITMDNFSGELKE